MDKMKDFNYTEVQEHGNEGRKDEGSARESMNIDANSGETSPIPVENERGLSRGLFEINKDAFKIKIFSLLIQMSNTQVRGDLMSGKFGPNLNPDILPRLDELRWMLLPRWQSSDNEFAHSRFQEAAGHLDKLMERSTALFEPDPLCADVFSYSEWMSLLELISNNGYWTKVSPNARCTHTFDEALEQSQKVVASDKKCLVPTRNKGAIPKTRGRDVTCARKIKVEEVVISSSNPSSSSDEASDRSSVRSYSSSSSSSSGRSKGKRKRERRSNYRRRKSDSRTVVAPPKFGMDGKTSLKDFLESYEPYFDNKYKGNQYDKTQVLGTFLTGELSKVFDARGGRKLKYRKMKEELLSYYRKLKVGNKTYWRKELESMNSNEGEPLDIFGMRLAEIAELAYPKDKKESAIRLRSQFFKRLPPKIVEKIITAEQIQKATSRGKDKYLPFSVIAEMAKDIQASQPKPNTVMWTTKPDNNSETDYEHEVTSVPKPQRMMNKTYSKSKTRDDKAPFPRNNGNERKSSSGHPGSSDLMCFYCKRTGHVRKNCWREARLCLICGQDHPLTECPKYNPSRHRSRSRTNNDHLNY